MRRIYPLLVIIPFLFVLYKNTMENYSYLMTIKDYVWLDIVINILPLLLFVFSDVYKSYKNENFSIINLLIRASFYVYLVYLIYFTVGYIPYVFIFESNNFTFNNVLSNLQINLIPLKTYFVDSYIELALYGNLILLFPLGFYLVFLYGDKINKISKALIIIVCTTLVIESTELFGSFLSIVSNTDVYYSVFDIDDILLNTFGGIVGYIVARFFYYKLIKRFYKKEAINT